MHSLLHQRDPNDPYFADERKQEFLINVQAAEEMHKRYKLEAIAANKPAVIVNEHPAQDVPQNGEPNNERAREAPFHG